ncbi:tRNA-uridine aminocarboxypropyltransferase 1 isoform X2 [Ranitomeya imitator]|uniref:tRNA-uridine aminocarboxypropyltransferase 1 isoform X2 n=1 Tax=Ranitomeya imitator TaxID=111125 RepID=UPI0037E7CC9B
MSSNKQGTSGNHDLLERLKVSSQVVLETAQKKGRAKCPKCNSSRMFYCYTCYVPVESVPTGYIPTVKVILVFPGPNAVSLKDGLKFLTQSNNENKDFSEPNIKHPRLDTSKSDIEDKSMMVPGVNINYLKKVVFIDSTWNQTNKIISDERLQGLVSVELTERKTCFWRHQKGSPETYLSTIEAIYYFMVDFHMQILEKDYNGDYDNLLFFFSFMYKLVRDAKQAAGKL